MSGPAIHLVCQLMIFSLLLQSERARTGLTQAEAAAFLGISKSALGKWETGVKTPLLLTQEGAIARLAKLKSKT